jgi:hypothetical protein
MGYCVVSVGNLLWVIVWRVVVVSYVLMCGESLYFVTEVSGQPIVSIYKRKVFPN